LIFSLTSQLFGSYSMLGQVLCKSELFVTVGWLSGRTSGRSVVFNYTE